MIVANREINTVAFIFPFLPGRDPSSVTNELCKKFYELKFGSQNTNLVVKRMREKKASRKWRKMYEFFMIADLKVLAIWLTLAGKQSHQVRFCTKVPPSRSKRSFYGGVGPGSGTSSTKNNLMKKAI
ncbi:hypothetical protein RJ639_047437 [Escallonia herrerae]|uniref:Uncharacterized protein n=1 Tax=Escallonia herrerae TaxID=1293975 RepID=A0AA88W6W7_9ASTE|nr:hypothetical protein RJ639_047437 [Escallonia herrerae]